MTTAIALRPTLVLTVQARLTAAMPADDRAKTPKTPKKPPPKKAGKEADVPVDAPGKQRGALKTRAEEEAERGAVGKRLACVLWRGRRLWEKACVRVRAALSKANRVTRRPPG